MMTYDTKDLLMHGRNWDGKKDLSGWIIQEKYNGCRAIWTGEHLVSRGGNVIGIPEHMESAMPRGLKLDGEIYAGRGGFQKTCDFVQHGLWSEEISFVVFDIPGLHDVPYLERYALLAGRFDEDSIVQTASHWNFRDNEQIKRTLIEAKYSGAEGYMAWNPNGFWKPGRTSDLLKVK